MPNRRAKIKNLAKKSLETGEDIDSIPESMRAYLAMQAMESGKGLGGNYFGRTGLSPFGHGNMLLGDPNSKVCECFNCVSRGLSQVANHVSDQSLDMPISEHRNLDACWAERHGSGCLLLT
jgi:hypothetical protein